MASLIIKVCGMTEAENIRNVEQLDVCLLYTSDAADD